MAFRDLCPALQNKTYFNYGGQGPLPTPSLEAITASWRQIQQLGPFTADVWPYISREVNSTRALLAGLCGVAPHRLALSENVTTGCVLPLWGLPLNAGDRILIGDCEHPGVVAACHELARRQHLQIDCLPVQDIRGGRADQSTTDAAVLASLQRNLKPDTRLVVLSHLLWNTGQLMPIAAVAAALQAHPNQPYLLVDAAQTMPSGGQEFEQGETLAGAGGGIELQLMRYLTLRLDAGVALSGLEESGTDVGDARLHMVGTLLY